MRALVVGLGVTGQATVRQLLARGHEVVLADDRPGEQARAFAAGVDVALVGSPSVDDIAALVSSVDVVCPTPGLPWGHPAIQRALAAGVPVWSEFELAASWDDRPLVAVTGTNGKTTVTDLVTLMLQEEGLRAVAAGNNDLPLVDALDTDAEVFVVEASSFRLQFTERFRPRVAVFLNLSPDHLDWHPTLEHYAAAKARIWAAQEGDDLAVANADDPAVLQAARLARGRVQTFGTSGTGPVPDYRIEAGELVGPDGPIAEVGRLPRRLPHDLGNALAACAAAIGAGALAESCRAVLERFEGFPHRVALVGHAGGVRWYDDSKATTPASVLAAAAGFESMVLIAGGRNKGLDLGVLRPLAPRLRGVVAIGEAADDVAAAFEGAAPVQRASSMDEAVATAHRLAEPGDAVLLSPGCASYDWYDNYRQRGDDFARAVSERLAAGERG